MGRAVGGNALIEQRIAAAEGLADADGHALAGFLDAEGCFQIRPNNRERTWNCDMTVAVRDDDAQLLTDLCRVTGLGRVAAKPAQGTSCPQTRWTIASKRECAELARILRAFPLRARKRRDFEIWARAVDRWASVPYDARASGSFHAEMADDAGALRLVRRYVNSPPPALDGPSAALDGPSADVLAYLGGFFSGEGCFGLSGLRPRAVIKLRADDRGILELFAERFGIGTVRDHPPYGNPNPCVTWLVCAGDEM